MGIKELCHSCVVVSNMQRSIKFYRDLLGLEVVLEKDIESPNFSKAVNIDNAEAKVCMMKTPEGNAMLELFEYKNIESETIGAKPVSTISIGHVAFSVDNIEELYIELCSKGVTFLSEPQLILDGVKFCYLRDPDGALIELIQFKA